MTPQMAGAVPDQPSSTSSSPQTLRGSTSGCTTATTYTPATQLYAYQSCFSCTGQWSAREGAHVIGRSTAGYAALTANEGIAAAVLDLDYTDVHALSGPITQLGKALEEVRLENSIDPDA